MTVGFKKWIVGSPDLELAKNTALELEKDPFSVMLAQIRGIIDTEEIDYYLSDELMISSPDELIDIDKAADIINEYIDSGLKIAIFGDYDCDGVCACAIMYKYLKNRGADVFVYIPDRISEGYGMNNTAIDIINQNNCKLIITVDNGISCKSEIDYASSLGIVTIVTDHHLPPEELPDAAAVVNPNRIDCPSSFKQICGAEVAFKVICKVDCKEPEELIYDYADLIAVATMGDSMPLIKENRSIVKYGIKRIKSNNNLGLTAVLSVAGIDNSQVNSSKLSFGIVPRINAAGRMGSAMRAFNLLIADDFMQAIKYANQIEQDNSDRQKTEREIIDSVVNIIEEKGYNRDRVIVAVGSGFHLGVVGIAAVKIAEKYGKPTIILSSDNGSSTGSCRSIGGFNIFDALKNCENYLERYGGHEMAAGLTVKNENISCFREEINRYAYKFEPTVPQLNLDFKLNPAAISEEIVYSIKALEPFGNSNPAPMFGIFGAEIKAITPLSQGKHIKLHLKKDGKDFNALLFGVSPQQLCFGTGDTVDLAVSLDLNTYMNQTKVSVIIKEIRPAGLNQDKVFSDIFAIDGFFSGNLADKSKLYVSRADIGAVYRYFKVKTVTEESLYYCFCNSIGYAKAYISFTILKELGLVSITDEIITINTAEKTELSLSNTYNILGKEGE